MLETLIMDSEAGGVHADEVSGNNATPRQQDVLALDSDGDVEEIYETPIALQRQKKKPALAPIRESEVEVLEVEESQQTKASFKGNKKQRKGNKGKVWICFFLID